VKISIRMIRTALLAGLLGLGLTFSNTLFAEDDAPPVNDGKYVAPGGGPPPVAPPLKKGSPLDHLANDPKQDLPTVGYKQGHTDGATYWIGHRSVDAQGGEGWGWIKPSTDGNSWNSGQWIALQETLGVAVAPHRKLVKGDADQDWEYKFWGHKAAYKAYDPHLDEKLTVFVLDGYEVIGPASPLTIKIGPPGRIQHRPSGASSRESSPILSDPGVD
jgi:hypothetical protein